VLVATALEFVMLVLPRDNGAWCAPPPVRVMVAQSFLPPGSTRESAERVFGTPTDLDGFRLTETWTYFDLGLRLVFEDDRLREVRPFVR